MLKIVNIIRVVFGFIFLAVGALGMLVPVWPTTPFVLVAVGCFSAAPKIRKRVLKIPFVAEYHQSYINKGGLSKNTARYSLIFLWSMLILSMALTQKPLIFALLTVIGLGVTVHILLLTRHKAKT